MPGLVVLAGSFGSRETLASATVCRGLESKIVDKGHRIGLG